MARATRPDGQENFPAEMGRPYNTKYREKYFLMDGLKHFKAQAIIFDKDGTLIDFDAMWGGWTVYLAEQWKQISGLDVRDALCLAMGYDEVNKKVLAHGRMAASPMAQLYQLTIEVMQSQGLRALWD